MGSYLRSPICNSEVVVEFCIAIELNSGEGTQASICFEIEVEIKQCVKVVISDGMVV